MMQKKNVRIIAAIIAMVLVAALLVGVLSSVFYVGSSAAETVSSLKEQLADLDEQKKELADQIAAAQDSVQTASDKKVQIDEQVTVTQQAIDTTQAIIDGLDSQISVKADELGVAQEKLDTQEALYGARARVMYENGEISYLDVILSADSFGDMISRLETMRQVMTYDEQLMHTYEAAKNEVQSVKEDLEADRQEQQEYAASLKNKKSELDAQLAESEAAYNSLNDDLAALQAESAKVEEKRDYLNYEVRMMSQGAAGGSTTFNGTFTWPLPGHTSISSPFGYRLHPVTGIYKLHTGTDLPAPNGTTIVAAGAGKVVKSQMTTAYGNYIIIDHGGGVMTAYAHMSKRCLSVGDTVTAGQQVGCVGSTGWSTGNHLHFEVIVNGSFVNPMGYF